MTMKIYYFYDHSICMQFYTFCKMEVPVEKEAKEQFSIKLMTYEVSLQQYEDAFATKNITIYICMTLAFL